MAIPDWITIATSDKSGGTGTSSTTKSISIKASENKSLSSRAGTITFKLSHGNSKTVSITQSAGVYSFGALSSSLTYSTDTAPASGGTLSSYTIWWSLPYGWNGSSSNAGTMNSSNYTNYRGVSLSSWSWSSSSSSVSVSEGKVTIPSAGTSVSSVPVNMATITATATLTIAAGSAFGNSSAISFTIECVDYVFRAANTAITSAVELIAYQPDYTWHSVTNGQWDIVPARGMCLAAQKRYKISYSSGEYEYTSPEIINTYNLSWSNSSMIQYHEWAGYDMVRVISRGTTVGDALSNTCTYTEGDLSASLTFTQEANIKTLVGIKFEPYQPDSTWLPIDSDGNWSICPAGDSYIRAGKRYVYSFSSGASENSGWMAVNLLDDLEWSDTSWIERHATTGVHVKSRGTVVGNKRSTTATLKESGFTASRVLTQEANTLSHYYFDPVVSLSCQDIPAGGGSISSGSVSYYQKVNNDYTSGSQTQSTLTSGGTVSYSSAVSAGNLGTTIKARSAVGTLTATVTMNGKSGSKSTTVYQEANTASYVYGDVNIGLISSPDVPASGGSSMATAFTGSQTIKTTYTSGSNKEESVTIQPSVRIIEVEDIPSLGTTTKERTLLKSQVVTWTGQGGKSASSTLYIYQEANKIESTTYGEPTIALTPVTMLDVPASGGSGNITFLVSQYQDDTFTSGSILSARINPSYTIDKVDVTDQDAAEWTIITKQSEGFGIRLSENTTSSERSGDLAIEITANGKKGYAEFSYSQKAGASVTTLASDPSSLYTSYAADTIEVVISMEVNGAHTQFDSEDDLTISSYPSWVSNIVKFIDTGDIVLSVFVTKNSSTSQRSGNIVIRMADGSASLSIPISQGQASTSSNNYSKIWFAIDGATSVPSMMYEELGIICSDYQDPDYGDYDCVPIGTYSHGTATFTNGTMRCLVSSETLKAVNVRDSISMLDDSMDIYLAAFPDGFSETAYCIARIDSLSDIINALDDVAANGNTLLAVTGTLV